MPASASALPPQEMLGNSAKARAIFERWMEWEPEDNAWGAYVKFEMRQEQPAHARYCTTWNSARCSRQVLGELLESSRPEIYSADGIVRVLTVCNPYAPGGSLLADFVGTFEYKSISMI